MDGMRNQALQGLRLQRQLSQWGLAALAGVAVSSVNAAERWGYRPGSTVRAKITRALGVAEAEIWPEVENEHIDKPAAV